MADLPKLLEIRLMYSRDFSSKIHSYETRFDSPVFQRVYQIYESIPAIISITRSVFCQNKAIIGTLVSQKAHSPSIHKAVVRVVIIDQR